MDDARAELTTPADHSLHARGLFGARPALWTLVLFFAAYVGAGALADGIAVIPGIAVIFWPPVGIMIATLLLNDRASWPWWIAAGCAAELTANSFLWHNPLPFAFIYYTGNALEALTAALLISRFAPKPFRFETIEQVLSFMLLAAGIAPIVSATIIASVEAFRDRHPFTTAWPLVWVGDATGLLISAPLTFVAVQAWRERENIPPAKILEAGMALTLLLSIAVLTLAGPLPTVYLTMPVLLWIATRFRLKGTAVSLGLLTLVVGSFTVAGLGQFAVPAAGAEFNLIRFHVFLAVSAISALFVAALSHQRLKALAELEAANRDLEQRVAERTGDLIESEYRLRLATEAAATGIWEWDLSGDKVEWTDRVFEIVGIGRDEFDGTNGAFIRVIHPDDLELVLTSVRSAIDNDASAECEFRIIRPNGDVRWVHDRGRVITDEKGRRMVGTISDITERKALELRSLQQFEELEHIYREGPVGMAVIDRDFRYVRVNEWLAEMNALPAGDHIGRLVRDVVPALADQAEAILRKVVETGETVRDVVIEGETPSQPNVPRAWSQIWHPIKNERGETIAVNVVLEDVTESRWGEQLLVEQNRLLNMIASARPLEEVLSELTAAIDRLEPRTRSAVLVTDESRRSFETAVSANLPQTYTSRLAGVEITDIPVGTCCKAVSCGEAVTSVNVAEDTRWTDEWRDLCLQHGIKACHSVPIFGESGKPMGTVVLGFDTPREPDPRGRRLAELGAQIAGVAIDRSRAEAALRSAHDTFRQLVENSPFGIYVVDADFKLARVGAGAQKVFENVRPLIGRDFAEVLRIVWGEPFATDAIDTFRRTLETGETYHSPRTIETRGDIGQIESYDWKVERITMPDGRFGVVCHFYDLSERIRYERELRESEERYRAVVESQSEMVCRFRLDGTILFVNEAYARSVGTTVEDLAQGNFWHHIPQQDRPSVRAMLDSLTPEQPEVRIENRLQTGEGLRWTLWTNRAISFDDRGRVAEAQSTGIDITERKRAEEALREQTELLRGITGSTPDLIYAKEASGRLIMANKATLDVYGHTEETAIGRLDSELYDTLEADAVMANDRSVMQSGGTETFEEIITSPRGKRTFLTTKNPLRNADGQVVGVVGISHDITDLKRAEIALRESETRQRLALEAGSMGTWTMPMDGRPCWADERTLALFDIPTDQWNGDVAIIRSRRFPEEQDVIDGEIARAIKERKTWRSEFRVRHRDGSVRWLAAAGLIEYGANGEPVLMRGINFDITERKVAEQELRGYHEILEGTVHERTRELAAAIEELKYENRQRKIVEEERQMLLSRLVAVQEEERRRIAQDLHDQLGQQLTALNMKLDAALRGAIAGDGAGHLAEARAMLRRIDDDVDALAWQLRPAMLDDDGFLPALRRYVDDWSSRLGMPADFWADETLDIHGGLSIEAETNLYRITQEALNNIAKYAKANRVEVLLKRRSDAVVLLIQDDGAGFDVAGLSSRKMKTMGIVGMRERAGLVGGTFQIESAVGEGTTVYVQIPLASAGTDGNGLMRSAGS